MQKKRIQMPHNNNNKDHKNATLTNIWCWWWWWQWWSKSHWNVILSFVCIANTRVHVCVCLNLNKWQIWLNSNVNLEFINQNHLWYDCCKQHCCRQPASQSASQPISQQIKWLMIRCLPTTSGHCCCVLFANFVCLKF